MIKKGTFMFKIFLAIVLLLFNKSTISQELSDSGITVFNCHYRLPQGFFLDRMSRNTDKLVWSSLSGEGEIMLYEYTEGKPLLDSNLSVLEEELVYNGLIVQIYSFDSSSIVVFTDRKEYIFLISGDYSFRWKGFIDSCMSTELSELVDFVERINKKH